MTVYNSPWGKPDVVNKIAHGITELITPSHGGLKLSSSRMKVIEEKFPTLTPCAGACWLEEHCDYAFAVVTWPENWEPKIVAAAVRSVSQSYKGKHKEEMQKACPEAIAIAKEYDEQNPVGGN